MTTNTPTLTLTDIAKAIDCTAADIKENQTIKQIKIDSRSINPGDLYVAIRGKNLDGHQFVISAIENGAVAVIVEEVIQDLELQKQLIVKDSTQAFGKIAQAWRNKFQFPIIGITGSSGKTTVKEMIAHILSAHFGQAIHATKGNLNNEYGVPITLLQLQNTHQSAVIEMGANHAGEIAYLNQLTQPDIALITNAGNAHLEGFGSLEGIAKAKGEIYDTLKQGAIAIINKDDKYSDFWQQRLNQQNTNNKQLSYGFEQLADISAVKKTNKKNTYIINTPKGSFNLNLAIPGKHNVSNAMAAIAVAISLNIPTDTIKSSLQGFKNISGRLETIDDTKNNLRLINDAYNANPESVKAGIEVLASADNYTNKFLIFGDMKELGQDSIALHQEIGQYAYQHQINYLYSYGELSKHASDKFNHQMNHKQATHFNSKEELLRKLQSKKLSDSIILVKGSRGMKMETIVQSLTEQLFGQALENKAKQQETSTCS